MKSYLFDGETGELISVEDGPLAEAPVDILALAAELTAQRARIDAAEDALDHLIVSSLEGDL